KIRDFEQKGNNWLEPMKEMILASSQAKILLSQSDNQEIRAFLKNIGSNFILKDKKFQFALKIGWRALAEGEPTKTFPNWRRVQDSNLCLSYERTVFETAALNRSANPPLPFRLLYCIRRSCQLAKIHILI
ncbi:MAG: Recombinase, partial [Candidatus Roizmanbacteria bacterium GW2011_GWC2_41_7]